MQLEIFYDIAETSEEILHFKELLKYSFHFNYEDSIRELVFNNLSSDSLVIDEIFHQCDILCAPLFHFSYTCDFFGNMTPSYDPDNFFYYNMRLDKNFWQSSIKYHCVISSLYTFIYSQLRNLELTSYKLSNHFKGSGYFTYRAKGLVSDTFPLTIPRYRRTNASAEFSNACADFYTRVRNFSKSLSENEINTFFIDSNTKKSFSLTFADLFYHYFNASQSDSETKYYYRFFNQDTSLQKYERFITINQNFQKALYDFSDNDDMVDNILFRYKAERFYNFSLNHSILDTLLNPLQQEPGPKASSIVDSLLDFYKLPNVFSRNLFFKFALSSYSNSHLEESIFYRRLTDIGPVARIGNPTPKVDRLLTWQDLCRRFIYFFSLIIFPVYERAFFCLLVDYIHDNAYAISLLHDYIQEHVEEILAPPIAYNNIRKGKVVDSNNNSSRISNLNESNQYIAKQLLTQQNSVIHPGKDIDINLHSLGFTCKKNPHADPYNPTPENKYLPNIYHRQLVTLIVESMLHSSE